jgi:hypothetical protein
MLNVVNLVYTLISTWSIPYATIPEDYKGQAPTLPYLRVSVISGPSKRISYGSLNRRVVNGLINIKIVTESGSGQLQPATVASQLDAVLEDKVLSPTVKLGLSSTQTLGTDPDDATKTLTIYSIPYTYFGD